MKLKLKKKTKCAKRMATNVIEIEIYVRGN